MGALQPVKPPSLVALQIHMRRCSACKARRGCATGVVLMRTWLLYEESARDRALRTFSPH